MNTVRVEYFSQKLKRKTDLNLIIPESNNAKRIILLLHGRGDDSDAWIQYTNVVTYNQNNLIILPSGDLSFYLNQKYGEQFQDYLIELIDFAQKTFKLQTAEVVIAGNSMGGYGSLSLALKYPQKFSRIGLFSPALSLTDEYLQDFPNPLFKKSFSNIEEIKDTELRAKIYFYCGQNDYLYERNQKFAKDNNLNLKTDNHGHEWPAWDAQIKKFLWEIDDAD